ncbi:MAG: PilZ domain-containing protein [Desulfurivibrionaceae bacterium]
MTKEKNGTEEIVPWELTDLHVAPAGANPTDAELQKIIRKNYREPIAGEDAVSAKIDGHTHQVYDIDNHGLGLIVPSHDAFLTGAFCSITLHLGDDTIVLRGKATHISPHGISGECLCGIEFINLNAKDKDTLKQFLTDHHARLFSGTSYPADLGLD